MFSNCEFPLDQIRKLRVYIANSTSPNSIRGESVQIIYKVIFPASTKHMLKFQNEKIPRAIN